MAAATANPGDDGDDGGGKLRAEDPAEWEGKEKKKKRRHIKSETVKRRDEGEGETLD